MREEERVEWHLYCVTPEEARASLDHHGNPRCRSRGCDSEVVLGMLMKPPKAGWGQMIRATAACAAHCEDLQRAINEGPPVASVSVE